MKLWISVLLAVTAFHAQGVFSDKALDSAALPLEHRGVNLPPPPGFGGPRPVYQGQPAGPGLVGVPPVAPPLPPAGPAPGYQGAPALPPNAAPVSDDPWPLASPTDMPQIKNLQVQCEKTHMRVNVEFDRPFYGMIFSKGHYSEPNCVHVRPGSGQLSATFDVYLNSCGMTSSANQGVAAYGQPSPSGTFVENTIIIQYDPLVQEVWDQARRLRCTWYDYYEKSVTFRPFAVDMLNAVTANFLGDNLQCWMQIQVGKGPWASEVSGIVKIGQTMTMVLAIKDDEDKFDMMVRNCVAHDGIRAPIQLVDQNGCVTRPKIMSKFQKVRNFGPSASVVSYAYFQAFKFPDSMNVHFQCVIQVCRYNCPEPKCDGGAPVGDLGYAASNLPEPRVPSSASAQAAPAPAPAAAPAPQQGYNSVNREGVAADTKPNRNVYGAPRSVEDEVPTVNGTRTRRSTDRVLHVYKRDAQEMTDVKTIRIIQVVAPGDVAFTLNPNQNETVVVQSVRDADGNSICMSVPSFVGGLTMLLLVLIIACMVAAFLMLRVRHFERKGTGSSISSLAFDNSDFVKVSN